MTYTGYGLHDLLGVRPARHTQGTAYTTYTWHGLHDLHKVRPVKSSVLDLNMNEGEGLIRQGRFSSERQSDHQSSAQQHSARGEESAVLEENVKIGLIKGDHVK